MIRSNKRSFIGLIWLLTSSLAACSTPAKEDIVGLWVEDRTVSDSGEPAICGSFEFYPDGRFEAQNIPSEYFFNTPPARIDASGSWKLDISSNDPFAVHRVDLIFGPVEGSPLGFEMELGISIDQQVLFQGQEGNRITFVKRDSPECE